MRISDWSSDVCSSDLPAVIASITIVAHDEIVPGRNLHRALLPLVDERQPVDLQDLVLVPGDLLGQQAGPGHLGAAAHPDVVADALVGERLAVHEHLDRKSTRLNSSH